MSEFQKGDALVCADAGSNDQLTIGSTYTAETPDGLSVYIVNNFGSRAWYPNTCFTKPRAHSELIKQWADDESLVLQRRCYTTSQWIDVSPYLEWFSGVEYRFKPTRPTKKERLQAKVAELLTEIDSMEDGS